MKATHILLGLAILIPSSACFAANLTGPGYIYITDPVSPAWNPANAVASDANIARLLWVPGKMAFRFGALPSTAVHNWDAVNLGFGSFSGGYGTLATGAYSFAFGNAAQATGTNSVAIGESASANSDNGVAIGPYSVSNNDSIVVGNGGYAEGYNNLVLGGGYGSGISSIAIGSSSYAQGDWSIAMATIDGATALGTVSIAIGNMTFAGGSSSTAVGNVVQAIAENSTALGVNVTTSSVGSVALGAGNVSNRINGAAATSTPQSDDPVFMVGKGAADSWQPQTRNALTIYRNGATHFDGIARVKKGGDISMGVYTAVPSGVQYP
jgi:hypothetical protein